MLEHFTEEEIERMHAFTETPPYERDPEQLLPDDTEADGATETTADGSARNR
jgi:hypothetical protein